MLLFCHNRVTTQGNLLCLNINTHHLSFRSMNQMAQPLCFGMHSPAQTLMQVIENGRMNKIQRAVNREGGGTQYKRPYGDISPKELNKNHFRVK